MYENTIELAENKLILLYIIKKIKYPISNTQLTEIVLENNLMNYFILQQYLTELISSGFMVSVENDSKINISISDIGERVLDLFIQRISPFKIQIIDEYIQNKLEKIKKEQTITADYTISENNTFIVDLKALEDTFIIMDLKMSVASKKQAQELCRKWKNNSSEIYNKIIKSLIE
ncbi:DUF4364 family protein [Clostridium polynesiense]|uniref:DUF4364 family protein n=1 Tax=Clostridium polynesiense TaxID=1325933 RepID=UPI00058C532D|nr:DUF4364 family protein [Clostridium polynesiense]